MLIEWNKNRKWAERVATGVLSGDVWDTRLEVLSKLISLARSQSYFAQCTADFVSRYRKEIRLVSSLMWWCSPTYLFGFEGRLYLSADASACMFGQESEWQYSLLSNQRQRSQEEDDISSTFRRWLITFSYWSERNADSEEKRPRLAFECQQSREDMSHFFYALERDINEAEIEIRTRGHGNVRSCSRRSFGLAPALAANHAASGSDGRRRWQGCCGTCVGGRRASSNSGRDC
jgi:hypothetical protein